jgi:arylsulfatase A-like enzyme
MPRRKNVLVFYTDQQRADSLGCMGNPLARTPNLDRLAARGLLYTQHYSTNPVCMPSRASLITGRYSQAHRVLDNGIHLPLSELTMPEVFRRNGYRTASCGKLHFQSYVPYENYTSLESAAWWATGRLDGWTGPYYGFEHVDLTVQHGERCGGAYGRWRAKQFPDLKLGPENAPGAKFPQFACWKSNLPLEAHHSTWVAERAIEFLDSIGEQPFYLHVSFPDPHHPFTPPAPYHSMFDDVEFPAPHAVEGENDRKPKPYRVAMTGDPFRFDGNAHYHADLVGDAYQQVVSHTYGMNTLIDDWVGRVIAMLQERGLLDNTLILFTSDHGDFLGDHHFLHKGQMPCRSLLHIPLIIADPNVPSGRVDAVCSNVDIMPTILKACGIAIPDTVQGEVLPSVGESAKRDYAYEAGWSKASHEYHHHTLYTQDWRISVYANLRDGELYNLREDPFEHVNLFHDAGHQRVRLELMEQLLFAMGAAEIPQPPVLANA